MSEYFNTNGESGDTLKASNKNAIKQQALILGLFSFAENGMTRCEVEKKLNHRWPTTSIQRSITNLTSNGKLVKLGKDKMRLGGYSKRVHVWQHIDYYIESLSMIDENGNKCYLIAEI